MKHPEKWRETIDPFSLPYHAFQPTEILGYPHAGNDVFYARGRFEGREVTAYIKAARQTGADIGHEVSILSQLHAPVFPRVIDCGFKETPFSVTLELPGERLSSVVGENAGCPSLEYMGEYGSALARLHQLTLNAGERKDRRFFHAPSDELLDTLGLRAISPFFAQPPKSAVRCFCHGDFHYANILWQEHHISGILDFELSGYGDRDFDIAWALFRRPGQRFLKTSAEQAAFLQGYSQFGEYNAEAVRYYMAQCYVYFLQFSRDDGEYCDYIRQWLRETI